MKMKLLTKELEKTFAKTGRQENAGAANTLIILKLFNPLGPQTWLISEYDPEERLFFGYASLGFGRHCDEWGYISLDELEELDVGFGLGIERDRYFKPKPFPQACKDELGYNPCLEEEKA